jgi:hypothetical protein
MVADVLSGVKPETVSDCVSSHLVFLLLFFDNLTKNDFVLAQKCREADASASAGQAATRTK